MNDFRVQLKRLRDTYGLKWAEITTRPECKGLPQSTLWDIYHDANIPKKHLHRFGVVDVTIPLKERKAQTPKWVTDTADWLEEREITHNIPDGRI